VKYISLFILLCVLLPCLCNPYTFITDMLVPLKDILYYLPQYFLNYPVYAFCNVNDFTPVHANIKPRIGGQVVQKFLDYKVNFVGKWLLLNILVAFMYRVTFETITIRKWLVLFALYYLAINLAIRSLFGVLEALKYRYFDSLIHRSRVN
jgi:hypothetical protein